MLGNTQKKIMEIWHQFWHKNDGIVWFKKNGYTFAIVYSSKCVFVFLNQTLKTYAIEIIFKSHEPLQSYQLTGPANSANV